MRGVGLYMEHHVAGFGFKFNPVVGMRIYITQGLVCVFLVSDDWCSDIAVVAGSILMSIMRA